MSGVIALTQYRDSSTSTTNANGIYIVIIKIPYARGLPSIESKKWRRAQKHKCRF